MKELYAYLVLSLTVLIGTVILWSITFSPVRANEVTDCDFKPRQSDEVIVYCGTLKGKGSVSVRLCGINYVIDMDCK